MEPRTIAGAVAAGRVAFGVAFLAAPSLITRPWLGADGDTAGARTLAAGLGARDLVLGAGVLAALRSGGARPWLIASALADAGDVAGTLRARSALPGAGAAAALAVAGGGTLLGAWLSAQDDW